MSFPPLLFKLSKAVALLASANLLALGICLVTNSRGSAALGANKLDLICIESALSLALPRVRDFRGINPNSFDGRGNYSMGIKEQLIFPEIDYDKIDKVRGMDICFVTTANTDEEARELLTLMGAPFSK